jgi:hypothetical protein
MATTTGIQPYYTSAYRPLPQKAIPLGSPVSVYESITPSLSIAGQSFIQFFQFTVPVGFGWASVTNFDYLKICDIGQNYYQASPASTVVQGIRIRRFVLRSSANAGNTLLTYIGFQAGNNLVGTGSALQGGAVSNVPIAGVTGSVLSAAAVNAVCDIVPSGTGIVASDTVTPVVITGDSLVLAPIAAVNLTTTLTTITGYLEFFMTGPVGF